MTSWVGEREMLSKRINIEILSLVLWPIDPLLSDALLYFYDNKHILILINISPGAHMPKKYPTKFHECWA